MSKTINLPGFERYGNYQGRNYGVHCLRFCDVQGNSFWFSYKTLVAFYHPRHGRVVHQNDWSNTTGKHLNAIDGGDKKNRVDEETFRKLFNKFYGD